jgi:peroxiredoxin
MFVASFSGSSIATPRGIAVAKLTTALLVFLVLLIGSASTLVAATPADWRATDFDGNSHALADYRGKIVVLNFWHAGCPWCMRSMRHVVALSDEFQGEPVAVLGVNSDEEPSDVRRVATLFRIEFPTLLEERSGPRLQDTYSIDMWPTVVVLDQKGEVRHVHPGYSPTLQDEIAAKVRELLAEG